MLTIALVEPKIPPNTGNIARLCAATGAALHLVGPLGFVLSDSHLKRAGLDYWHLVRLTRFEDTESWFNSLDPDTIHLLSSHATTVYTERTYGPDDILIFGSETEGLPEKYRTRFSAQCCTIPMANKDKGVRSLNLANAAGIVLYEAIRQVGSR